MPTETLLLIPLDDTVVFPSMDVTLPVDTAGDEGVCASMLRFHGCVAFGACR